MKKYYIGLIVLMLTALGFVGFAGVLAGQAKQDKQTAEHAQKIAEQLNEYITDNRVIPDSLDEADIRDVPTQISYTKDSETEYTFCTTYHSESSFGGADPTALIFGSALRDASRQYEDDGIDNMGSTYKSSSLYISSYHKKGKDCQTIKPYLSSGGLFNFNYNNITKPDSTDSVSTQTKDAERQADIRALHTQVEAYHGQWGQYPTLANMNDTAWRKENMKSLDDGALKTPGAISGYLYASSTKMVYAYRVSGENGTYCDNDATPCTKYVLEATLEDGSKYTKEALN